VGGQAPGGCKSAVDWLCGWRSWALLCHDRRWSKRRVVRVPPGTLLIPLSRLRKKEASVARLFLTSKSPYADD
jgi:hypothetical protein